MNPSPDITLPEGDPDLYLAQQIGDRLDTGSGFAGLEDGLIGLLLPYKVTEKEAALRNRPDTQTLWKRIERRTSGATTSNVLPFYRKTAFRGAAAVLLVAALIGLYWIFSPAVDLVAESGAEISRITLSDGSKVTLRPYSRIYAIDKRAYRIEGEARFSVIHNPDDPFSVEVSEARITVLGTRFIASDWGEGPQIYLEEGSVRFEEIASGEAVTLQPGQRAALRDNRLTEPDSADARQYTDWINHTLVLNNSTFEELIAEIEQHFGITVTTADSRFTASDINGTYRLSTVDSTLRDIGLLLGGTFTRVAPGRYRFQPIE